MDFERLDTGRLEGIRTEWLGLADRLSVQIIRFDYEAVLNQLLTTHKNSGHSSVWAVTEDGESPLALTLLHHARPESSSPWLKMLEIHLRPDLHAAAQNDDADLKKLARLASVAVVGAYGATFEDYPSDTLKVLGRDPLDTRFIAGVLGENQELAVAGIEVKERGAWIFLEKPA